MTAALPLIGHRIAEDRFLSARASERLHHGWIVQGPSGIGKALFVKRLAALMLGAAGPDAPEDDGVMQKVLSGSHPDLKWLRLELNDKGKLRQDITVDQVRDLNKFFSLRPALAGWRVGVIDALDETNRSGFNALLKTLEEPPANSILFLLSHGRQPVIPTIRSRCQLLRLNALSDDETAQVFDLLDVKDSTLKSLAAGRPGYGLELKDSSGLKAVQAARNLLRSFDKPTSSLVAEALRSAIIDKGALHAFSDALLQWVADQAETQPSYGKVWFDLHTVRATADEVNLTPLQTATKMMSILQDRHRLLSRSS